MDDVINFGQQFHFFQKKKMLDHNKVHIHKKFQEPVVNQNPADIP